MRTQNLIKGEFCLRGDYFVTFTYVILCNTKWNTNPFIFTAHCQARRCPGLSGNCIAIMHFQLHNKKMIASITGPLKILRHVFNFQPGKYLSVFIKYCNTVERLYINAGTVFWFHSLLFFFNLFIFQISMLQVWNLSLGNNFCLNNYYSHSLNDVINTA